MPPRRVLRKGDVSKVHFSATPPPSSMGAQERRVLRDSVERVFCGTACCVRQQETPAGVRRCLERLATHLLPETTPFVENARLLEAQLPCPACQGDDGLCCKDARAQGAAFETAKLQMRTDLVALEQAFQTCAVHAGGIDSACVRSAAACTKQHLESYLRHAEDHQPLPLEAIRECHGKAVRACRFHGQQGGRPCSFRCVLGTVPRDRTEAVERSRAARGLPPGCTVSGMLARSFR